MAHATMSYAREEYCALRMLLWRMLAYALLYVRRGYAVLLRPMLLSAIVYAVMYCYYSVCCPPYKRAYAIALVTRPCSSYLLPTLAQYHELVAAYLS
eukprot:3694217-Rhodomonas_salina.1